MRSVLMYVLLVYFELQLLAFTLTQLFYCVSYLTIICGLHIRSGAKLSDFLPGKIELKGEKFWFFSEQKASIKSFTALQVMKFFLTEGEKIVMIYISPIGLEEQGEYSQVMNFGSMFPAMFFAPVEEVVFNTFSRLQSQVKQREEHFKNFLNVFKFMTYIGLFFAVYGWNYSYGILKILYSDKWTNDTTVTLLRMFFVFMLFMAMNGVTEAFYNARADEKDIKKMQKISVVNAITYLTMLVLLSPFKAKGVLLANMVNFGIRIFFCLYIMTDYNVFKGKVVLLQIFKLTAPDLIVALCFVAGFILTSASKAAFESSNIYLHFLIGGVVALINLAVVVYKNLELVKSIRKKRID